MIRFNAFVVAGAIALFSSACVHLSASVHHNPGSWMNISRISSRRSIRLGSVMGTGETFKVLETVRSINSGTPY